MRGNDVLSELQWFTGRCLTTGSLRGGEGKPGFVASAYSLGGNIPTRAKRKLRALRPCTRNWEKKLGASSLRTTYTVKSQYAAVTPGPYLIVKGGK